MILMCGDALAELQGIPDEHVNCVVTSPPYYGLRDYGVAGQLGVERTPAAYVTRLVEVFREVRRVLTPDGTVWLNLGDSYVASGKQSPQKNLNECADRYAPRINPRTVNQDSDGLVLRPHRFKPDGLKSKDLIGVPWSVALALRDDGWYLRSDIIWVKPNPMPESVTDRPTRAHEYIFLLAKSERYYYDHLAVLEPFADARQGRDGGRAPSQRNRGGRTDGLTKPSGIDPSANGGRNRRSVWTIASQPYKGAHFAVFPEKLIEPCVLAGCPPGGTTLDPFCGSGTVGVVCARTGRDFLGIDLNPEYLQLAKARIGGQITMLGAAA